ncbi:MAG: hypothetical protein JNN25_08555 [Candidatus Kapabacteria bacterium]|nr:hypothetical protein [Candidatus Kapabacteria bacterium]
MKKFLTLLFATALVVGSIAAQEPQKKEKKKQFVYVLKLIPRLLDEKAWTKQDEEAVSKHFRRLQKLHKEGTVLFAGRTLNESESSQFGMVVFEATSEKEAETLMQEDDAVKAGIMKAQLFPFAVALK